MKVIVSFKNNEYSFYIPKKDMESKVIEIEREGLFGGTFTLENGMKLYIEPQNDNIEFPKTFEARKV